MEHWAKMGNFWNFWKRPLPSLFIQASRFLASYGMPLEYTHVELTNALKDYYYYYYQFISS